MISDLSHIAYNNTSKPIAYIKYKNMIKTIDTHMKNINCLEYEPISPTMSYIDNKILDDKNKPLKKRKHDITSTIFSNSYKKYNQETKKDIICVNNGVIFSSKIIVVDDIKTVDEAMKIVTELEEIMIPAIEYLQGIDKMIAYRNMQKHNQDSKSLFSLSPMETSAINQHIELSSRSINYVKYNISLLMNREKIMTLILNTDHDVDKKFGPHQQTISQYAVSYCFYDNAIKILNKCNKNINCVTSKGLSLLHLVLYSMHPEINDDKYRIACYLINKGINVNMKDNIWQSTALHIICGNKFTMRTVSRLNLIELIMKKNGDATINNFLNHTPIDYANNLKKIDSALSESMMECMHIKKDS